MFRDDTTSQATVASAGSPISPGTGGLRVGEVIDASTTSFTAEAHSLHEAPPFGGFVRAGNGESDVIAVVSDSHTGSIDPGRRPVARGRELALEADVYSQNPELLQLLRTEFEAVAIGFRDSDGKWHPWLPGRPPRIHAFVYECSPDEVAEFTADLDFVPTLLANGARGPVDELIAAALRAAATARGGDRAFLVAAGKALAALLAAEPNRLGAILRRIRP